MGWKLLGCFLCLSIIIKVLIYVDLNIVDAIFMGEMFLQNEKKTSF